ncbi:uncharacterized protein LOC115621345 [Scaptodrosophila lebanonensis]|uniref:Uncharacterized protein LOC115621345 n=1 Tax=Drosophila lebanonensis TaxID=7225 RepID=A0A6J2T6D0_DROLE|nr:uncharacterized protein LOC115621345 [Scaptodrosophila lebanonensis]
MSSDLRLAFVLSLAAFLAVSWADTLVQLHVNRPYNDVSEKFVSFAVKPEDLYDALDGPNRKALTGMAAMLGDSYVKFIGDFYFATNAPKRLRNPTKIIWKGFNRWTRAVNWTMIIPVPYAPDEWDSMHTLKILNTSYMVGITDCIWQLGTDFGTSRAKDYVRELNTLKLMSDTFKPYVDDWRVMGADISAGSSAPETRRYVDMTKDVNAAFGWTQPPNMLPASSLGSYIFEGDPALKVLQQARLPLWLTLPQEKSEGSSAQRISKRLIGDETTDALRWAQTLGDAASTGFDVVFKRMTLADFKRPNYSFWVTALFKKVMGSRVFPARPLNMFAPTNKLYTHCANDVSGGLAFMVVNTEDQPTTITVRSLSRLASSEVWQYILTANDGRVRLNNEKLSLNSTLRPVIKSKDSSKMLQLITPTMSVGFWVLPNVNLEHCQYTEVEAEEVAADSSSEKDRSNGYSSADRLLQRLIEETSVTRGSLQSAINRQRRFVLENQDASEPPGLLGQLLQRFKVDTDSAIGPVSVNRKRESVAEPAKKSKTQPVSIRDALVWLRQVLEQTRDVAREASGQRRRRSVDSFRGPFFYNRQGKRTTLTKKITEIRRPEQNIKPIWEHGEFDEEEFFKKVGDHTEPPPYTRLPEGDVHLKHIETQDGEEEEQDDAEPKSYKKRGPFGKKSLKIVQRSQEIEDGGEHRKQRLLPTEFFEALPAPIHGKRLNLGATLNTLLFPEPFSSKATIGKSKDKHEEAASAEHDVEPVEGSGKRPKPGHVASDFLQAQRELGKHFLSHIKEHQQEFPLGGEGAHESSLELEPLERRGPLRQPLHTNIASSSRHHDGVDYFGAKASKRIPKPADEGITSWWDLPARRRRRALPLAYSTETLRSNAIDKDGEDELLPLGNVVPGRYSLFDYRVDLPTTEPKTVVQEPPTESIIMKISKTRNTSSQQLKENLTLSDKIVTTVKSKVSKFMHIISRHMNEWYNTLSRHLETGEEEQQRQREAEENAIRK